MDSGIDLVAHSEDEDAMDEDAKQKPESQDDDLSQYNLDEYDKESTSIGKHIRVILYFLCRQVHLFQRRVRSVTSRV